MNIDEDITSKKLRDFGLFLSGFIASVFGLGIPYFLNTTYPIWPWFVAVIFCVLSVFLPEMLRTLYLASMRLGQLIGKITTPIILGLIFFGLIFPFGYVYRFVAGGLLQCKLNKQQKSYRVKSKHLPRNHFERPF